MLSRSVLSAAIVVLISTLTASAAETVDSVEKKLMEQATRCKSARMTLHMTADVSSGDTTMTTSEDTVAESVRKSGKTPWRADSRIKRVTKVPKQKDQVEEGTRLMICDSQYVYTLTHVEDQNTATKTKATADDANPFDVKSNFDDLRKQYSLKLLPDAAVEGKDSYVIEAVRNKPDPTESFPQRIVSYYDKKTGLPRKSISYDASGKTLETTIVTDIKVNIDIPAERFVFKAPAGVPVLDMTKVASPTTRPDPSDIPAELPDE